MSKKDLYILKLAKGKYYVGLTTDLERRLEEHFSGLGDGSAWTEMYPPVKLLQIKRDCTVEDETNYTLQYMRQYGSNNVRGGAFCGIDLPSSTHEMQRQIERHNNDACFNCGARTHYANDCPLDDGYDSYDESERDKESR